jgi:hypothetical protein
MWLLARPRWSKDINTKMNIEEVGEDDDCTE